MVHRRQQAGRRRGDGRERAAPSARPAWPARRRRTARRRPATARRRRRASSTGAAGADRHAAAPAAAAATASTSAPIPPSGAWNTGPAAGGASAPQPPGAEQQAAPAAGEGGQLGHHRQAEAVGVGGVDAADEGVDEALVDLVAEPAAHERADRVVGVAAAGQQRLERGAQLAAPPTAGRCVARRSDVGRHAEQQPSGIGCSPSNHTAAVAPVGDVSSSPRPTARASAVACGHAGEEGVGALVDGGQPGERRRAQLAAEAVVGLAHLDRRRRPARSSRPARGRRSAR